MQHLTRIDQGDNHVTYARDFAAPPRSLYAAHVEPDLARQWLIGPDGWVMDLCEMDVRPGGAMHYRWSNPGGDEPPFELKARVLETDPPHRLVHVETMYLPTGPDGALEATPENRVETSFAPNGTGTRMTMRLQMDDPGALEAMLASGMEEGMESSYLRLEGLRLA